MPFYQPSKNLLLNFCSFLKKLQKAGIIIILLIKKKLKGVWLPRKCTFQISCFGRAADLRLQLLHSVPVAMYVPKPFFPRAAPILGLSTGVRGSCIRARSGASLMSNSGSRTAVAGRIKDSQRCPCPDLWNLGLCHLTWQKGIKVAGQLSPRWGE